MKPQPNDEMRLCHACKELRAPKDMINTIFCRLCNNKRTAEYYRKNREKISKRHKAYNATEAGKLKQKNSHYKSLEKEPEKHLARYKVRYAVSRGKVIKKPCRDCGSEKVEAHHYLGYDEAHWYDVIWLCRKHHWDEHKFSVEARDGLKG